MGLKPHRPLKTHQSNGTNYWHCCFYKISAHSKQIEDVSSGSKRYHIVSLASQNARNDQFIHCPLSQEAELQMFF